MDSSLVLVVIQSVVLGIITLASIIGNAIVIAAILLERSLQNVANYLIISLAVADLLVACLVMPLGAVNEINEKWVFGPGLCDFWTSSDVLCCTASILSLVAIALDRYWAVTNINYMCKRNSRCIFSMIAVAWTISLVVALAPLFGWNDPDYWNRINIKHECIPNPDFGYQMFSYTTTLFIPLPVMLFLYWKIYQAARKSLKWRKDQRKAVWGSPKKSKKSNDNEVGPTFNFKKTFVNRTNDNEECKSDMAESNVDIEGQSTCSTIDAIDDIDDNVDQPETSKCYIKSVDHSVNTFVNQSLDQTLAPETTCSEPTTNAEELYKNVCQNKNKSTFSLVISTLQKQRSHLKINKNQCKEDKKEKRAAKVLAIITGVFVVCWLPFFIMNFLRTTYGVTDINPILNIILSWLPYFNSTLNPILYTIFSPEFRLAFQKLLFRRIQRNERTRV